MNMQEITWPTHAQVVFHGRNGTGLCAGLEITEDNDKITLTPITRRNKPANCHIEVPLVLLPEIIAVLRQMCPRAVRRSAP